MNSSQKQIVRVVGKSFLLGLSLLLAAFLVSGAGHGTFALAKMAFPYTMLGTYKNEPIRLPFIVVALLQYPLYGYVWARCGRHQSVLAALVGSHLLAVILAFTFSGSLFD